MHSHRQRHGGLSRWLATGAAVFAAVFAVAIPVAASASASAPPTEPAGSEAAGTTTEGTDCSTVFPLDAPATSDAAAPAGDTATAETMAAPDTAAAETAAAVETAAAAETAAAGSAADSAAPADAFIPGPIQTAETSLGTILVDGNCRALYLFTADVDGESTCFDGCATAWPPALVENGEVPELAADLDPALFSVVDHPLGPMLKVGDFPLYYFASDTAPGDLNGQAVNEVWWVVAPDGTGVGMDAGMDAGTAESMPAGTEGAAAAPADSEPKATDSGY
ncbi:hypothetical protein [Desertimonas flava]|uniref:COG4315 family predicted lipoprotein n=1 Tax=Desertimonas flava TaxID=2064846 RepID=UPI000E346CF5|nr:hypothetical protein [Desertimonas flava]